MLSFRGLVMLLPILSLPALAQNTATESFPQEFSAEMVVTSRDAAPMTQRLFVSKGRVRIERGRQTFIHNLIKNVSYELVRGGKRIIPVRAAMKNAPIHAASMQPRDLFAAHAGPCDRESAQQVCKKLGTEKVNERTAEKWLITDTDGGGPQATVWIDPALKLVVRYESPEATLDLKNLQEGPQADSLFKVPADHQKTPPVVDPEACERATKTLKSIGEGCGYIIVPALLRARDRACQPRTP